MFKWLKILSILLFFCYTITEKWYIYKMSMKNIDIIYTKGLGELLLFYTLSFLAYI